MREVVPNVYLIEELRGANVYVLGSDENLSLVDSGMTGDTDRIVAQLQEAGHPLSHLRSIILTHGHGDHSGGALALVRRCGAPVVAHRDEKPYIERTGSLPAHSLVKRLLNWLSERLLFRLAPCHVDRAVEDGDVLEALGGMHVIHAPGHTPGSMALYHPGRRILFCGDVLFNAHPITGRPGLRLPIPLVTVDNAEALNSVRRLSRLPVEVLCCGHGEPIVGGADERLKALLQGEDA